MAAKMRAAAAIVAALVLAVSLATFATTAESHPGHPQKKLFPESWHYTVQGGDYDAWMTLSTSDVWLDCDGNQSACGAKWKTPFDASMADWNAQPDTVEFDYADGVRDDSGADALDLNVYIQDDAQGDPTLLGIAPTYGQFGFPCFTPGCVYSGEVYVGDDAHSGDFGTPHERQGTISHEVGHIIQLAHESVNANESQQFACGMDDTGTIPYSIMSYNCIDPPSFNNGFGLYLVEPWDVCGVNHKYVDPAFPFTGCDGTLPTPSPTPSPTPTPPLTASATASASISPTLHPTVTPSVTPTPSITPAAGTERIWGDVNCNDAPDPVDSLAVLRFDAGLNVNSPAGCPAPGAFIFIDGEQFRWGNVDCLAGVNPVDSLKILLADAGSPAPQLPGCPELGDTVLVSEQAPT